MILKRLSLAMLLCSHHSGYKGIRCAFHNQQERVIIYDKIH